MIFTRRPQLDGFYGPTGEEVRICSVFKKMLYESDNFHIMKVSAKYAPAPFPI